MKMIRLTFSMRTLLVAITLIGLIFGYIGHRLYVLRSQVLRRDGWLARIAKNGDAGIKYKEKRNEDILLSTIEWMEGKQVRELSEIRLGGDEIDTGLVAGISDFPELTNLIIIADDGPNLCLTSVTNLRNLKHLTLGGGQFQSTEVAAIVASAPDLTEVCLVNFACEKTLAKSLSRLVNLQVLRIDGTAFSDQNRTNLTLSNSLRDLEIFQGEDLSLGLNSIFPKPNLLSLAISKGIITEDEMLQIVKFQSLQTLRITASKLPRTTLRDVFVISGLQYVDLQGSLSKPVLPLIIESTQLKSVVIRGLDKADVQLIELLGKFPKLTHVGLPRFSLRVDSVGSFCGLSNLTTLELSRNSDEEALTQLRSMLPNCKVKLK